MKILMVSSFPPMKCGIGAYAYQMVQSLKKEGIVIDILSPLDGGGDFHENLRGHFNVLKIIPYARKYDRIFVQYHESFFYLGEDITPFNNVLEKIKTHLAFMILFVLLYRKINVIVHEVPYYHNSSIDHRLEHLKWITCPKLIFHTLEEVKKFESFYFPLNNKYQLSEHNKYFVKFCTESSFDSRKKLCLSLKSIIFLCIGFIQPHKGFDRAVKSFQNVNPRMELFIVGSLRVEWKEFEDYLGYLMSLSQEKDNIHVISKYLSDEEFDCWINACDVIVIPYREIWSSSVLARGKLYNKPIIAADIGGLRNQLEDCDILFQNDDDLMIIFEEFSSLIK